MTGVPSPQRQAQDEAAWTVAEELGEFTRQELMTMTGASTNQALDMVHRWLRKERIHLARKTATGRHVYATGPRGGDGDAHREVVEAEASTDPRRNMWRAMQLLDHFSPIDLAAVSNLEVAPVSERDAQQFCQSLLRGEYLRVVEKAKPGHKPAVYRLVRRTGPKPPVERRVAALFDENLGELTYVAGIGVRG